MELCNHRRVLRSGPALAQVSLVLINYTYPVPAGICVSCNVRQPCVSDVGTSVAASWMHQAVPTRFAGWGEKHLPCSALMQDSEVCVLVSSILAPSIPALAV